MMNLTPTEMERLTIFSAAELARRRRAKGLRLSYVEAIAYITDEVLEGAREGRSVAELVEWGATLLTTDDVRCRHSRPSDRGGRSVRGRNPTHRPLRSDPAREAAALRRARQSRRGDHPGRR